MSGPQVVGPTEVFGEDILDRIGKMRFDVWNATGRIDPAAFPGGTWRDPLDLVARHFTMEVDGELVAAVRFARFDRMGDMPEAPHYRASGLDLQGTIGLPERLVVRPGYAHFGFATLLSDHLLDLARRTGIRWIVTEASAPVTALLVARGRWHVGPAALDPRFPGVAFQLVVTDMSKVGPVADPAGT